MERRWWWKFILLLGCLGIAGMHVYPTVAGLDLEKTQFPIKRKINLGLDLQGGLYMVLGVNFNQVYREVVQRQLASLQSRLKDKGITVKNAKFVKEGHPEDDPRMHIEFNSADKEKLYRLVKDEFWILRLTNESEGMYELGLAHSYRKDVRQNTLDQSIEVIRNRIDQFGVAEPSITSQGAERLVVELPGVKEVERAKALIGKTAKLEWKLVDEKAMNDTQVLSLVKEIEEKNKISFKEGEKFSQYVTEVNKHAKGRIPEKDIIAFERVLDQFGNPVTRRPYLLFAKSEITGEELQDAQVQIDPERRVPVVNFTLNPRGATLFEKVTREHVRERLAIVLDNVVYSAPMINGPIPGGRGQITLGSGNADGLMKEAKDLAIVLRAGALPAQLEFLEERVVGPSLGQDSIRYGSLAGVIGVIAVLIFISIYYRVSGFIAALSLLMNVIFVMGILVGMDATLTLPGIAGIALTVGIAVDSNVVIYERIREELRLGKSLHGAVESGFQKAFRTILDANITNAAAALVLLSYGTGPVKGFAVTLLIGIITTVFTAVFVCRMFFDLYLKVQERKANPSLSI